LASGGLKTKLRRKKLYVKILQNIPLPVNYLYPYKKLIRKNVNFSSNLLNLLKINNYSFKEEEILNFYDWKKNDKIV